MFRPRISLVVVGFASLLLVTPLVAASDYYVSPTGDDGSGDGSEGNPWRHIGFAESHAVNGDTIWVMDDDDVNTDDYVESVVIDVSIVVEAYDNDGTRPQIKASAYTRYGIQVEESNVTLRRLDVYGATNMDYFGITIDKRDGISSVVVENVVIDDCRSGWDATHTNYHGIYVRYLLNGEVKNSTFSYNDDLGILMSNSSSHIANNSITGNTVSFNGSKGIFLEGSEYNTISGNTCDGNYYSAIELDYSDNNLITENQFLNTVMRDGIYVRNTSTNNTLRENVSIGNNEYGVSIDNSSGNLFYCNEFDGILGSVESSPSDVNAWDSPSPEVYKYGGNTFTAVIGNNYHENTCSDADANGICDAPFDLPGAELDDSAPLFGELTNYVFGADIFADGFESGDQGAWQ
jgi:parallel beta-helix repeat protein